MTELLRFVFAGRVVELGHYDPLLPVLAWLRGQGRRGAKEACGVGGCGACTVVIGELAGGRVAYRAVNACSTPLGRLDGRLLLTVEDLTDGDGALHPAQRALQDAGAASCGFCAPGLVMSLFALHHSDPAPDDDDIQAALAGHACRCAGRDGLLAAARRLRAEWRGDRFNRAEAGLASLLESLTRNGGATLYRARQTVSFPARLEEMEQALTNMPDAAVIAGGAGLARAVAAGRPPPVDVVFTDGVAALRRAQATPDGLEIGAGVSLTDAAMFFDHHHPELAELIRQAGPPQWRNGALLAGALRSGAAVDLAPALLTLGTAALCNRGGAHRLVDLAPLLAGAPDAALRPGEFIQALHIPPAPAGRRFAALRAARDGAAAVVAAAFALDLDSAGRVAGLRAAFSGVGPHPARAETLERWAQGRRWGGDLATEGAAVLKAALRPAGDRRGGADYRGRLAVNLWRRFCLGDGTAGPDGPDGRGERHDG